MPLRKTKIEAMQKIFFALVYFSGSILFAQESFVQSVVPPSPNASAMIKYANIQVSHYTGVPNISIPFGELPGRDISIPVGLQYHASGIKVQDVASSVGLGWNLYAGGAITRVAQGIPDGIENYCSTGTSSYWSNYLGSCDGERDIFYFNFLGRAGKMFFDEGDNVHTMPYSDLIIEDGINSGMGGDGAWIITDERGYKYYFGESAGTREQTTYYTGSSVTGYTEKFTFTATWYLNKIVSPTDVEVASFTYYTGSDFEYEMFAQQKIDPSGAGSFYYPDANTKVKIKQAKYINAITTDVASVQFSYLNTRQDLINGWQLNTVSFKDQYGGVKRKFQLLLDYFSCNISIPSPDPGIAWPCRLRLASIMEGVNNLIESYSFAYNETSGNPDRNNFHSDHYGYYNYTISDTNPYFRLPEPPLGCESNGVKKSQDADKIIVFSLAEIKTNTGGRTVFEYDQIIRRSLRIKSISDYDGSNLVTKSTFTYGSDQGVNIPVYSYDTDDGTTVCSSSSFRDLYDLNGTTVGYSTVTETFLDGSKIIREFTNFSDYNDTPPVVAKYKQTFPGSPVLQGAMDINGPPFTSTTSKFWMRGLSKKIRIYDSQTNLLKEEVLSYEEGPVVSTVSNTAINVLRTNHPNGDPMMVTYISGVYNLESRPVYLTETKSRIYDQNGYTNFIESTTSFAYHSLHKTFPTAITRQVGTGPSEKVTYRYPTDVTGGGTYPTGVQLLAGGVWGLENLHVIEPVEQVNWYKDFGSSTFSIVGAQIKAYKRQMFGHKTLLHSTYNLQLDNPIASLSPELSLTNGGRDFTMDSRYRLVDSYNIDNTTALLTSSQSSSGITSSYQWINNALPSSVITNPGVSQHKKDFVHNSINGLTQQTDENSRNTHFEYESNTGKIRLVRDHDNNIVTRYRYQNQGEDVSLPEGSISASGCQTVNASILFTASITTEYGQTTYEWDFGDGTTATTTSGNQSHAYSTAGNYTVNVKRTNPEYFGETQSSTSVSISSAITSASVCANGVVSYDICGIDSPQTNQCLGGGGIEEAMATAQILPPCSGSVSAPTLSVTVAGSVSSYQWQYKLNSGSWINFGSSTSSITGPPGYGGCTTGTYSVRCIVEDACGNSVTSSTLILTAYASTGC